MPIGGGDLPKFCNFIEANVTGAIPLSKKLSFITDIAVGSEYFQQIKTMPELYPCLGFNLGSRLYSPQFAGDFEYAPHKLQTMISLQFDPWDDITILGGKVFLKSNTSVYKKYNSIGMKIFDTYEISNVNWADTSEMGKLYHIQYNKKDAIGTTHSKNAVIENNHFSDGDASVSEE